MRLLTTSLILFLSFSLLAQKKETTRILFIFDGSNSMNAQWQTTSKIDIAKRLMTETLDSLKGIPNIEFALRMYGHQTQILPGQQDCEDTKLEVPFAEGDANIDKIKSKIRGLTPKGTTPIARSLQYSADDFPSVGEGIRNVIILITDGIEACDEDPCAVARALASKGITLKPFIVGIGPGIDFDQLKCIGNVYDASTEDSFKSILKVVISQAISNTTVQVNLNNIYGKPLETNVAMSFYDQRNGRLLYNFIHTLNYKRIPDTLNIDPLKQYKLVVHTIPAVVKENIQLTPGTHNTIELNTPQGSLELRAIGSNVNYQEIRCIVKEKGSNNTLHVMSLNQLEKLIVGSYDLEFLTLPRINLKDIKIEQSKTTDIKIAQPGSLNLRVLQRGYGAIFTLENGVDEWVCNLEFDKPMQQYNLQPGKYKIVYRNERHNSSAYTIEKTFKISSGQMMELTL
jgi:Ca-activated chloride channel homolog